MSPVEAFGDGQETVGRGDPRGRRKADLADGGTRPPRSRAGVGETAGNDAAIASHHPGG
jgi:hypothetical protein